MPRALNAMDVPAHSASSMPEPFKETLGPYEGRALGDHFDLTQFGVNLEILPPKSRSALRHFHSQSDEFVLILEGELTLVTDEGETRLTSGMCAGFNAGSNNGHHLINKSNAHSTFLVVGARMPDDKITYPDDDFQWLTAENGSWYAARKDGAKY